MLSFKSNNALNLYKGLPYRGFTSKVMTKWLFWPKKIRNSSRFLYGKLVDADCFPSALPYETDGDAHWKF